MNKLDMKKQTQIVSALVEGNSIRATCRMTGAAKGTVLKLLVDIGKACSEYQDKVFRDLSEVSTVSINNSRTSIKPRNYNSLLCLAITGFSLDQIFSKSGVYL